MRYWWANQTRTYDAEIAGGFLWSRRRRSDGRRNPFYDNMRLVRRDDLVFAYAKGAIRAVGLVLNEARDAPCPEPLAETLPEKLSGWLVDMAWLELRRSMIPADYMAILEPLLPTLHAPLTGRGRGIQGGRLLELSSPLALVLLQLAGGRHPSQLINPPWKSHQLRFAFEETP